MQPLRLTLTLCAALVLGACGSGASEDDSAPGPVFSDESGAGGGTDAGAVEGSTTDQDVDTGSDAGAEADGEENVGDGREGTDGSTPDGSGAEADDETGVGGADPVVIQPGVPGNIAATRLVLGMERVLKATLLDLNLRHADGSPLSEQQQDCLGTYDPALGEPAFALGCERALATGDVEVYVERGALYRTADCAADLLAGTTDRCVMESARVIMRTQFHVPPRQEGQGRPRPLPGSGVIVGYAIDAPLLALESDEQSPLQPFDCAYELQNGAILPSIGGRDVCDAQVRDAADLIDFLAPVVL